MKNRQLTRRTESEREASGLLAWDMKKRISVHTQITTSLCQEVFATLERYPQIVRIPQDVGPWVGQLLFPASVLA